MAKQQIGVIGLAVMGKNLALNIADHGFSLAVYNRSGIKTDNLLKESDGRDIIGAYSLEELVDALEVPRRIILMVKAGEAVDDAISRLVPLLSPGDLIMDGGNSHYLDTIRRSKMLEEKGIYYLGTGISGGEEGALKGPAIMPGGSLSAYRLVEPVLDKISAKVGNEGCSTYIGPDGSGHFVKMVHNGIEYAVMQLIAEAYFILKNVIGLSNEEMHEVFKDWNEGELNGYLVALTADIFTKRDEASGRHLVDLILDSAGQKGTGKWTIQASLDLGVPVPTIAAAVYERVMSSMKEERMQAQFLLKGPAKPDNKSRDFTEAVGRALYSGIICAYAQGFALMTKASAEYGWSLSLKDIAGIFRGGCIIRAQLLNHIMSAYDRNNELANLITDDYFTNVLTQYQAELRMVIKTAISAGLSVPALSSALSYYDSYRSGVLPTNLIQAQRDYFGAHTYRRIDKEGIFHTQW